MENYVFFSRNKIFLASLFTPFIRSNISTLSHQLLVDFPSTSYQLLINFPSPPHIKTSPVEIMGSESASLAHALSLFTPSIPLSSNSNSRVPPSHSPSVLPFNLTSFKLLSRFRNNVSQEIWIAKRIQIQRIFPETAFECSLTLPTCSPPAHSKHND